MAIQVGHSRAVREQPCFEGLGGLDEKQAEREPAMCPSSKGTNSIWAVRTGAELADGVK